jgi:hypothetical protein
MKTPRRLLRDIFAETKDPGETIRQVRECFGMSLDEAKKLWLDTTGLPVSMTKRQEAVASAPLQIVCPKCRASETIERKLHTLPSGLGYQDTLPREGFGPQFVNGFWCRTCEVGFVPNHLLDALGLEVLRSH